MATAGETEVTKEVGTGKLFENDDIVMWEFVLEPGESVPCHLHVHDYVMYVIEGSRLEVFFEDGSEFAAFDAEPGAIIPLVCEGDWLVDQLGLGYRVPASHSARNGGTTRYREILVETKRH
jgi:hypothetical protein